jgi:hypothetical protein
VNDSIEPTTQPLAGSWFADAEEILQQVGDRRGELVERAVADDVHVNMSNSRREIIVLLHGMAQAVGRSKTENKLPPPGFYITVPGLRKTAGSWQG